MSHATRVGCRIGGTISGSLALYGRDAMRWFLMEKDVGLDQRHEGACGISAKQCAVGATNGKKKKKTD